MASASYQHDCVVRAATRTPTGHSVTNALKKLYHGASRLVLIVPEDTKTSAKSSTFWWTKSRAHGYLSRWYGLDHAPTDDERRVRFLVYDKVGPGELDWIFNPYYSNLTALTEVFRSGQLQNYFGGFAARAPWVKKVLATIPLRQDPTDAIFTGPLDEALEGDVEVIKSLQLLHPKSRQLLADLVTMLEQTT